MNRFIFLFLLSLLTSSHTLLANEAVPLKEIKLETNPQTLQQGARVVMQTCMRCHSLKYIKYNNLTEIGLSKSEIDQWRGNHLLSSPLTSSMPAIATEHHFGGQPPDLSLMAKAKTDGENYIYTLLTSYYRKQDYDIDNHIFPAIRMPDVLAYSIYDQPEERQRIENQAQATAIFLTWAADPHAQTREQLGVYVLVYLFILSALLFLIKQRIWSRLR